MTRNGVAYVTTGQAATAIGVQPHLIRDWARRGLLDAAGRHNGRPVYRLDQVHDAERATRQARTRRGGAQRLTQAQPHLTLMSS